MKFENLVELKSEFKSEFKGLYDMCDPAHKFDHFGDVESTGLHMNKVLCSDFDPRLIMGFAYLHDLFTWSRANHEKLAHEFALYTDRRLIVDNFDKKERQMIAKACLTHRASYRGEFDNCFSELMSSADRGVPSTATELVTRSYAFHKAKNPEAGHVETVREAVSHIKEKYGENGYANYPVVYLTVFGKELEKRNKLIADLDWETFNM